MRVVRIVAIVLGVYVGLGLLFDSAIGYFQPHPENTVVLRTFESGGGAPKDTVLSLLDDSGQLWVESGHWFRGWYHRVEANPEVELVRNGETLPYRAIPDSSPDALDRVVGLMRRRGDAEYLMARTMLLWAPIKPVRLEPRTPATPAA